MFQGRYQVEYFITEQKVQWNEPILKLDTYLYSFMQDKYHQCATYLFEHAAFYVYMKENYFVVDIINHKVYYEICHTKCKKLFVYVNIRDDYFNV